MSDLQVTQEVVVELENFYNVDLFQRGYYQVRCLVQSPPKLFSIITCQLANDKKDVKSCSSLFKAFVDQHSNTAISKTFEVYYKHEKVQIKDKFIFKIDMLMDGIKMDSQLLKKIDLTFELYFAECTRKHPATPKSLEYASSKTLTMHLSLNQSYHAHRPVLFDYFHFGALTFTVHSCTTAIRQPWLAALKSLHPVWSGKSGNIRQLCYSSLFGKGSILIPTQKLDNQQKNSAIIFHRNVCLKLLKLYEQLLLYYHWCISLLPEYSKVGLSKIDIYNKLEVLNNEFSLLCTAEENYLRVGDDLYLLSTELDMLWQQFLEQFSFNETLVKKLAEEHHKERIMHIKQAVFTEEHPWESLCVSHELSTSQHNRMANAVRNSLYYQLIPPLKLHCSSLDADGSTLPIIFEDKYMPGKKNESEQKQISITVDESVVDGDFVDMDIRIEGTTDFITKLCNSNENQINHKSSLKHMQFDKNKDVDTVDSSFRRSNTTNNGKYDMMDHWQFSPSDLKKPMKETDLTGPEYSSQWNVEKCVSLSSNQVLSSKELLSILYNDCDFSSATDFIPLCTKVDELKTLNQSLLSLPDIKKTFQPAHEQDLKPHLRRSFTSGKRYAHSSAPGRRSVFYTPLNGVKFKETPITKETLFLEGLDLAENKASVSIDRSLENNNKVINLPSPSDLGKPKLWSCFPAIKSSSKRNSYRMSLQSPYAVVTQENSSRFQRAKENLEFNLNFRFHNYSHFQNEINVKEYFTQKITSTTENVHLVVCVHGLDGNRDDLRLVRCYLEMASPLANFDFLMSEVNQDDTFCDIDIMTQRLVEEIKNYISEQKIEVSKMSFIGHSLGNIIIRNAVIHSQLFEYRSKLWTFLSLSGPHLGIQFHTSNLVSTGMWLMQKWKKGGSLVQLALNDSTDLRDTFMYRLSLTNGFQYFKNVLLVSSVQDHYVPFHSARVEMSKQVLKGNTEHGRVYKEMLDNIMNPLMVQESINIIRYTVYHPMPTSADSFIGRAAHIAMLDSELFLEKFILVAASSYIN
ncbi:protein FAM135A isoform X1 [Hydra vulgaris]|uniref:protein FAM135A isoform X1 n=1 Tax=Hydra vulgaris TaxID=6087 RepID=UPI001F5FB72B|nr:protein FAM135A [Hydra vulgaris]